MVCLLRHLGHSMITFVQETTKEDIALDATLRVPNAQHPNSVRPKIGGKHIKVTIPNQNTRVELFPCHHNRAKVSR